MGSQMIISQAEVMAQEMMRMSCENRRMLIMIDSQAAPTALKTVTISSREIMDCIDSLAKSAKHIEF